VISLGEDYTGYDATSIGFPSIDGCHAIMVQSENGMYGYHSLGGSQLNRYKPRATAFASFATNHKKWGSAIGVYSVCFRSKRGYRSKPEDGEGWDKEIKEFADAVNFHGNVLGFDLSTTSIDKDSSYVEYRLENGGISVYFKRWPKMERANATRTSHKDDLKYIQSVGASATLKDAPKLDTPIDSVIRTFWNKGEIHKVDASSMDSFAV
jgi:hypothetical protein